MLREARVEGEELPLKLIHCWGRARATLWMGDAASRSYATTMAVLSKALGMPAQRLPLNTEAQEFLRLDLNHLRLDHAGCAKPRASSSRASAPSRYRPISARSPSRSPSKRSG